MKGLRIRILCASFAVLALALLASLPVAAATLFLSPSIASPPTGSSFSLDLVITGLGNHAPPSLGAFDVVVAYDPGAVTFSGATFGGLLGTVPAEALAVVTPGAGSVEVAEVSLLSSTDLAALQPSSFTLARLNFVASVQVPSAITIQSALLADGDGLPISIDSLGGASITPTDAVPEPGAALLYAAGLLVVARSRAALRRSA
jgi:hypothetical protein